MRAMVMGVVGDDEKAGCRPPGNFLQEIADPGDVLIVERRVDLVENAYGRGIGEKDGHGQRERGQGLFASGQQGQHLQSFSGRAGHDLEPGLEGVVRIHQRQMGVPAPE